MTRASARRVVRSVVAALLLSVLVLTGEVGPAGAAAPPPSFITDWGAHGTGNGLFDSPFGVAVDPSTGDVYVADTFNHRIQKFQADGGFLATWGSLGSGDGQFEYPYGVAVDPSSGDVYVSDFGNDRVQEFEADGTWLASWGTSGSGDGQLSGPWGLAVDPSTSDVLVVDRGNSRVERFDSTGGFLDAWGSAGTAAGQFSGPIGIAVDPTGGAVYVTENLGDRVQRFAADGTFVTSWGSSGTGNGEFAGPGGVAVDASTGNVYVTDSNRVRRFAADGTFQTKWGSEGSGDGQFGWPSGVAVVPTSGDIYVADYDNDRIQAFGYPGRPDGRLRRGAGILAGDGIYNTTGVNQTRTGSALRGQSVSYLASVQNDAESPDRFRLEGLGSTPNVRVRYLRANGEDITLPVTFGTYYTWPLDPQEVFRVRIVVTIGVGAPRGASVTRTLTAASENAPTVLDTVRFITHRAA